jgi:translation initiation factor 1
MGETGSLPAELFQVFRLVLARILGKNSFMADDDHVPEEPQKFGQNPFDALSSAGLPPGPSDAEMPIPKKKSRGRVDIIRQKAGRGGKTVTVVTNFVGIGLPEKEKLAKQMQKACGVGGTVKEGRIEIQGDKRPEVARILEEAGFRPVFAGG